MTTFNFDHLTGLVALLLLMVLVAAADARHVEARILLMTTFYFDQLTGLVALLVVTASEAEYAKACF